MDGGGAVRKAQNSSHLGADNESPVSQERRKWETGTYKGEFSAAGM